MKREDDMPGNPTETPEYFPRRDRSLPPAAAGIYGLLFAVPAIFVPGLVYLAVWGAPSLAWLAGISLLDYLLFVLAVAAGMIVHELLHALGWSIFGNKPLRGVKLGFQLRTLTPYAACSGPIVARAYRLGVLTPMVVLGALPALLGLVTGSLWLVLFGMLFLSFAGGDFLIIWLLRGVPPGSLVEDHPENVGCRVLQSTRG